MPSLPRNSTDALSRLRRSGLAVALWVFGLSTTVLLVGVWGRSVANDRDAIEAGARAVLESGAVAERITGWIAEGIESGADELPPGSASDALSAVWNRPQTRAVIADAVDRLVDGALAPGGERVEIDLTEVLRPLVPIVLTELATRGAAFSADVADSVVSQMPTIVLDGDTATAVGSVVTTARATLTKVVAAGLGGMLISAFAAVLLAEERLRQLRVLAVRVGLSAVTFALLLRIGAWALDPGGGRSPLAAGGSVVLASGVHVLVIAALIAGGIAAFATVGVRRRRRAAVT